jgi:hypothetical protein
VWRCLQEHIRALEKKSQTVEQLLREQLQAVEGLLAREQQGRYVLLEGRVDCSSRIAAKPAMHLHAWV